MKHDIPLIIHGGYHASYESPPPRARTHVGSMIIVVCIQAQELAEAETKNHVAEEAADVTYFMVSSALSGL